ncbi:MAG: peptide deformylase [Clostridia bacterium]|nr:peptide deformylase [Clostridia bacterium]
MIRPIMKDPLFLSKKSETANISDMPVALDLLQTLGAHAHECVGMAANMIGVSKKIIVFTDEADGMNKIMFNPVIAFKSGEYEVEEGCLSLPGVRKTKRYNKITVEYQDMNFKKKTGKFSGFTAQIIQHEIDMTNGILI